MEKGREKKREELRERLRKREDRAEGRERQRLEVGERLDVQRFNQRSTLSTSGVGGRHPSSDILGGRDMKNDV